MPNLSEKQRALYEAIAQNELMKATLLLRDESEDFSGDGVSTPMIEAVKARRYLIIMLLFKRGVDLSRADDLGCIALHYAAYLIDGTATLLLCIHNSPKDVKNNHGFSPLTMAIVRNHYDIVRILADNGATVYPRGSDLELGDMPIVVASSCDILNIVEYSLNIEDSDDSKLEQMHYALCGASYRGRRIIVTFLIFCGVELSRECSITHLPLVLAIESNHNDIVKFLLSNRADANEKDERGYTPLMYAATHRADPKVVANGGQTTVRMIITKQQGEDILKLINL